MNYIFYKVTNLINGKFYVGVHKTKKIEDGYMGSGTNIKRAIIKYGKENFKREILEKFSNEKEMFEFEKNFIDETFLKKSDTYNINQGGFGGWNYVNQLHPPKSKSKEYYSNMGKNSKGWNHITLDQRKKYGKSMGQKFGGRNKLTNKQINERLNLIKEFDLTKYGWVNKVSKTLNLTHTQTKRFIDSYYEGEIYRRNEKIKD